MYFCYFDESGDSGYINSPTPAFALAAVIVDDRDWLNLLDQIVSLRQYLRGQFHIPARAEIKATWLIRGQGALKGTGLSASARINAYEAVMRFQRKCGIIRTFAVVINKSLVVNRARDPRSEAWMRAIERLERFGTQKQQNLQVFPDEGHSYFIRRKMREMRRFHLVPSRWGSDQLDRKAENVLEDPSERESHESYFIQLADLNAYAALRRIHPVPAFGGSMWEELGDARIPEVNRVRGGPRGIVCWPR
jgi:hypothetical protein